MPRPTPRSPLAARPHFVTVAGCTALLTVALQLLAPPPALAADPAAFAAAHALLQKASAGDAGAVESGAAQWRALSAAEPQDPVLRAYAGAMTAMQATTTLLPWKKLSYTEDGLALIDKALAQLTPAHDAPAHQGVPASLETRFTAASTFLALPGFLNRGARGAHLLEQVQQHPQFSSSPARFQDAVRQLAARHARDTKDAKAKGG